MLGEKLILVGGRWHVARLIDYGHIGMGWGDPEDTSLICVAGDEERVAELPLPSGAEPVAWQWKYRGDPQDAEWWRTPSPADLEYVRSRPDKYELRGLYASPQSSSQVTEEPAAVTLLRGALSQRATSAEFNEWQAREVVAYIDALTAALSPVKGDGQ